MRATGGPGYGDPLDRPVADLAEDLRLGFISPATARDAYGAVLAGDGVFDPEATAARRAELRQRRMALPTTAEVLADLRGGQPPAPGGEFAGTSAQVLGEHLEVTPAGVCRCRRCGHEFCDVRDNWKWHAAFTQDLVSESSVQASIRERDDLYYRRYFCPGCGVQTETEVALPGEPPRWNFRPLSVWHAQQGAAGRPAGSGD
jgi:N-methylhydantoinase B